MVEEAVVVVVVVVVVEDDDDDDDDDDEGRMESEGWRTRRTRRMESADAGSLR